MKYTGKSKSEIYKGVYKAKRPSVGSAECWVASGSINGVRFNTHSPTERGAALKYDMKMIENGKEPVNILKRKV